MGNEGSMHLNNSLTLIVPDKELENPVKVAKIKRYDHLLLLHLKYYSSLFTLENASFILNATDNQHDRFRLRAHEQQLNAYNNKLENQVKITKMKWCDKFYPQVG